MRKVVVLPAPFGPSRPMISPSRASKPTPLTACTGPPLALNDLCRFSSRIMSGLPSVRAGKGGLRGKALQAAGVQRRRVGGFDELRKLLGHAAGAQDTVALSGEDQVAAIGQVFDHLVAVARG